MKNILYTIIGIAIGITMCYNLIANEFNKDGQALIVSGRIKDVHDGDTVTVSVTRQFKVRLLDCWAAEINSKEREERIKAEKAKDFLKSMLKDDDEVYVEIPLYDSLEKSLTFGRVLGYIWKDIDGDGFKDNISVKMVENNHATKHKEDK